MIKTLIFFMIISNQVFANSHHCKDFLEHAASDVIYYEDFWTMEDSGALKIDHEIRNSKYKNAKYIQENKIIKLTKPTWGGLRAPKNIEIQLGDKGEVVSISTYKSTKLQEREEENRIEFKYKDGICYPNEERRIQDKWKGFLRPLFNLDLCNELKKFENEDENGLFCKCDLKKTNQDIAKLLESYKVAPFHISETGGKSFTELAEASVAEHKTKKASIITKRAFAILEYCRTKPGVVEAFNDKKLFPDKTTPSSSNKAAKHQKRTN